MIRSNHRGGVAAACGALRRAYPRERCRPGRLSAALLAGTALATAVAATAHGQESTWTSASGIEWHDPANWSAGVPTGTATFDATAVSPAVYVVEDASIGTLAFTADAPAYFFGVGAVLTVTGTGVDNASAYAPTFWIAGGSLVFSGAGSAGDAIIDNSGGTVTFAGSSTAGTATIGITWGATVAFTGSSTAGAATIANDGSFLRFVDTATAGAATITNTNFGSVEFLGSSTAGTASITNSQYSGTGFGDESSADRATIVNGERGSTAFTGGSTAGFATITNQRYGTTSFGAGYGIEAPTAGSATIVNDRGTTLFWAHATAGDATITNSNGGSTVFNARSTAGSATIVTNAGSKTEFYDYATGGLAAFVTIGTGSVNFGGSDGVDGDGRITAGSIAGSGRYAIGGGNTLVVGGNDQSTEVSGVIADRAGCCGPSGSGALEKVGTGTLTLSGISTYTGTTAVYGGALIVDGSIASSSSLTVGVDGTVGGPGVLPSTTVYGTLSPGSSIGSLTVNGDLTLAAGSTYRVELSSAASDLTHVTGTATLGGTLAAVLLPGETAARRYTVLTADGGLSGSFSDVTLAGLPSWYTAVAGTLGNDVVLDIGLALAGVAGLSGDQRQVAATLDRAFNTGPGLTGLFADLLAAPSIPTVLTQLTGEIATGAASAAFRQTDQFLELMLDPFAGSRGIGPAGGPALAFAPAPAGSPAATAVVGAVNASPDLVPDVPRGWRVWGGGFGGDARYRGDAAIGSHDLSVRNWGLAGGADYRAGPDLVLGLALAGGETAFSLGGLGSGRSGTIQIGGYGSWRAGAAYVSAAGTWGAFDVTTDRTVTTPATADRLNGAFTGQGVGGRVETGMRLAVPGDVGVIPFAAVTAQAFRAPAYAETDAAELAGFALTYAERTTSAVRSELGARFDVTAWRTADAALTVRGRLGWAHAFSTERAAVASFVNLSPAGFTVLGAAPAADAALVSAGAELKLSGGVTLRAGFDGQLAGATQIYSGTGSLAVAW